MAARFRLFVLLGALALANARATPSPSAAPKAAVPSPSPPASMTSLIDSLQPAELQQVIPLLKSNYINPAALTDIAINRATLEGLMTRLGHGIMLLPKNAPAAAEPTFYSEVLGGHIGYARPGALTSSNLAALDTALKTFAAQKVDVVILDLRASAATNDFGAAADFATRFCPKGQTLFVLRKPAAQQEQAFHSERDPSYRGLLMVLADGDTAGPAEALAGVLRLYDKAMIIGQPTAGRAVEYSDLLLASGKLLRVAVSEALLPGMQPLYPGGVKPDLPVEMPATVKRQIFQESLTKGMARFVYESERPHFNEAALLSGDNPEIDAAAARQHGRGLALESVHDAVAERAVDLITSLAVYQNR